jgi:ectoine hydroxylase-related dioxygenase (phytanoyl-CoA dioxygenase family)
MHITDDQQAFYAEQGFLFLPELFSMSEVNVMKSQLPDLFTNVGLKRTLEKDHKNVRSIYGSHKTNDIFHDLVRHPRIVEAAKKLLDSEIYVHQFKINAKAAFGGDMWEWHQDYIFWQKEDGIPMGQLTNAVVFLDEVNEFNGPLFLVPCSQKEGVIDVTGRQDRHPAYAAEPSWISNLTINLKYSIDKETLAELVARYGMVAPKGPAGSVLFFHANLVHGSSANMSPFDRNIILVSYNRVDNLPSQVEAPRPDFLASRDYEPIVPLAEDVFAKQSFSD